MKTLTVLAGTLFDPESLQLVPNQAISICPETGEILDVQAITSDLLANLHPSVTDTLDLRHLTILPGFVDAHVHSELLHAYNVRERVHSTSAQCFSIHTRSGPGMIN
jgi:cytosine/adenosine deaminase-related metal-dependent hydrolase